MSSILNYFTKQLPSKLSSSPKSKSTTTTAKPSSSSSSTDNTMNSTTDDDNSVTNMYSNCEISDDSSIEFVTTRPSSHPLQTKGKPKKHGSDDDDSMPSLGAGSGNAAPPLSYQSPPPPTLHDAQSKAALTLTYKAIKANNTTPLTLNRLLPEFPILKDIVTEEHNSDDNDMPNIGGSTKGDGKVIKRVQKTISTPATSLPIPPMVSTNYHKTLMSRIMRLKSNTALQFTGDTGVFINSSASPGKHMYGIVDKIGAGRRVWGLTRGAGWRVTRWEGRRKLITGPNRRSGKARGKGVKVAKTKAAAKEDESEMPSLKTTTAPATSAKSTKSAAKPAPAPAPQKKGLKKGFFNTKQPTRPPTTDFDNISDPSDVSESEDDMPSSGFKSVYLKPGMAPKRDGSDKVLELKFDKWRESNGLPNLNSTSTTTAPAAKAKTAKPAAKGDLQGGFFNKAAKPAAKPAAKKSAVKVKQEDDEDGLPDLVNNSRNSSSNDDENGQLIDHVSDDDDIPDLSSTAKATLKTTPTPTPASKTTAKSTPAPAPASNDKYNKKRKERTAATSAASDAIPALSGDNMPSLHSGNSDSDSDSGGDLPSLVGGAKGEANSDSDSGDDDIPGLASVGNVVKSGGGGGFAPPRCINGPVNVKSKPGDNGDYGGLPSLDGSDDDSSDGDGIPDLLTGGTGTAKGRGVGAKVRLLNSGGNAGAKAKPTPVKSAKSSSSGDNEDMPSLNPTKNVPSKSKPAVASEAKKPQKGLQLQKAAKAEQNSDDGSLPPFLGVDGRVKQGVKSDAKVDGFGMPGMKGAPTEVSDMPGMLGGLDKGEDTDNDLDVFPGIEESSDDDDLPKLLSKSDSENGDDSDGSIPGLQSAHFTDDKVESDDDDDDDLPAMVGANDVKSEESSDDEGLPGLKTSESNDKPTALTSNKSTSNDSDDDNSMPQLSGKGKMNGGNESEEDLPPLFSVSGGKGKGKGKGASDNDNDDGGMPSLSDEKSGKGKGKGGSDSDEDEEDMPSLSDEKSGKGKGKGGSDSDEDEEDMPSLGAVGISEKNKENDDDDSDMPSLSGSAVSSKGKDDNELPILEDESDDDSGMPSLSGSAVNSKGKNDDELPTLGGENLPGLSEEGLPPTTSKSKATTKNSKLSDKEISSEWNKFITELTTSKRRDREAKFNQKRDDKVVRVKADIKEKAKLANNKEAEKAKASKAKKDDEALAKKAKKDEKEKKKEAVTDAKDGKKESGSDSDCNMPGLCSDNSASSDSTSNRFLASSESSSDSDSVESDVSSSDDDEPPTLGRKNGALPNLSAGKSNNAKGKKNGAKSKTGEEDDENESHLPSLRDDPTKKKGAGMMPLENVGVDHDDVPILVGVDEEEEEFPSLVSARVDGNKADEDYEEVEPDSDASSWVSIPDPNYSDGSDVGYKPLRLYHSSSSSNSSSKSAKDDYYNDNLSDLTDEDYIVFPPIKPSKSKKAKKGLPTLDRFFKRTHQYGVLVNSSIFNPAFPELDAGEIVLQRDVNERDNRTIGFYLFATFMEGASGSWVEFVTSSNVGPTHDLSDLLKSLDGMDALKASYTAIIKPQYTKLRSEEKKGLASGKVADNEEWKYIKEIRPYSVLKFLFGNYILCDHPDVSTTLPLSKLVGDWTKEVITKKNMKHRVFSVDGVTPLTVNLPALLCNKALADESKLYSKVQNHKQYWLIFTSSFAPIKTRGGVGSNLIVKWIGCSWLFDFNYITSDVNVDKGGWGHKNLYGDLYDETIYRKKGKALLDSRFDDNGVAIYNNKDSVLYTSISSTGETKIQEVEIIKVHIDDIDPYYTIQFDDMKEKQTIAAKLAHIGVNLKNRKKGKNRCKQTFSDSYALNLRETMVGSKNVTNFAPLNAVSRVSKRFRSRISPLLFPSYANSYNSTHALKSDEIYTNDQIEGLSRIGYSVGHVKADPAEMLKFKNLSERDFESSDEEDILANLSSFKVPSAAAAASAGFDDDYDNDNENEEKKMKKKRNRKKAAKPEEARKKPLTAKEQLEQIKKEKKKKKKEKEEIDRLEKDAMTDAEMNVKDEDLDASELTARACTTQAEIDQAEIDALMRAEMGDDYDFGMGSDDEGDDMPNISHLLPKNNSALDLASIAYLLLPPAAGKAVSFGTSDASPKSVSFGAPSVSSFTPLAHTMPTEQIYKRWQKLALRLDTKEAKSINKSCFIAMKAVWIDTTGTRSANIERQANIACSANWLMLSKRLSKRRVLLFLRNCAKVQAKTRARNNAELERDLTNRKTREKLRKEVAGEKIVKNWNRYSLVRGLKKLLIKERCSPDMSYYVNQRLGNQNQDVFKGRINEVIMCAVKKLRNAEIVQKHSEIIAMKALLEEHGHEYVLEIYAVHRVREFMYMGLERCHGSVADPDFFSKNSFSQDDKIELCRQAVEGVYHLHGLNIFHRDIKPSNLLYKKYADGNFEIKVADMGITVTAGAGYGSQSYLSKELLELAADPYRGPTQSEIEKGDTFALGLVMHFILTKGVHPFRIKNSEPEDKIGEGVVPMLTFLAQESFTFGRKNNAIALIQKMISHDPEVRGDAESTKESTLFWSAIKKLEHIMSCYKRADFATRMRGVKFTATLRNFLRFDWRKRIDSCFWVEGELGTLRRSSPGEDPVFTNSMFDYARFVMSVNKNFLEYLSNNHAFIGVLNINDEEKKHLLGGSGRVSRTERLGVYFSTTIPDAVGLVVAEFGSD